MSPPSVNDFQYEIGARMARGDWAAAAAHDLSGPLRPPLGASD